MVLALFVAKAPAKRGHIRAVYTRENKPRIWQSAAYASRELSNLYGHSLSKELVRGLSFLCRLYEQFATYISRGLCNPRLIFPRINSPIVARRADTWKVSEDFQKQFMCPGHKICVGHKCCARCKTSQQLSHLYDNSLYKKLVRGLPCPNVAATIAPFIRGKISRGLHNPRLM